MCFKYGLLVCSPKHRFELRNLYLKEASRIEVGDVLQNPIGGIPFASSKFITNQKGKVITDDWKIASEICLFALGEGFEFELTFVQGYFNISYDRNLKIQYTPNTISYVGLLKNKEHLVDIEVDSDEHMYVVNGVRTHNTFNFQSVYGGGPGALASTIGISMDDARDKQQRFFGVLKGLKSFIRQLQMDAEKKGYCLTAFGRRRLLPDFKSDIPKIRANGARKATNTPVQGSAADLMKTAMVLVDNYIEENGLEDKIQMLITMHDELVFRVKKSHIDRLPEILGKYGLQKR